MAYQLKYSDTAVTAFDKCLDYLIYHVGNTGSLQAAENFIQDFEEAIGLILSFPFGFTICERLSRKNQYKIHFHHLNYKIFYHVEDDLIVVDLIVHDSQDYKNLL